MAFRKHDILILITATFFIVSFLSIITSCQKTNNLQPSIIGKWTIDSIQDASILRVDPTNATLYRNKGENYYWNFKNDGR